MSAVGREGSETEQILLDARRQTLRRSQRSGRLGARWDDRQVSGSVPPEPRTDEVAQAARTRREERASAHLLRLDRVQLVLGPIVVAFFLVLGVVALTSSRSAGVFLAVLCLAMVVSASLTTFRAVRRLRQRRSATEQRD
ncbi:hypothetical protein FHX74_002363 [Friedmanniella endophytica]|uniref:Uncharacterized protein n=1 Tax=Microlunatus kandeliicorticis TaxID=1759536 RepID=A0A7W3P698_9ACTN|nr:hypothetical protein [Microlunatus kandeliicorticis]MBA8794744.1 hypothetical protein [Microlunatus kandeliicorticis]